MGLLPIGTKWNFILRTGLLGPRASAGPLTSQSSLCASPQGQQTAPALFLPPYADAVGTEHWPKESDPVDLNLCYFLFAFACVLSF